MAASSLSSGQYSDVVFTLGSPRTTGPVWASTVSSSTSGDGPWSVATSTSTDSEEEEELCRKGIIPSVNLVRSQDNDTNARTRLLNLHQQTHLVSTPIYHSIAVCGGTRGSIHGQTVTIEHYVHGEVAVAGYGSQVALARECAAERMLELIRIAEDDLDSPVARLHPAPLLHSRAVEEQRKIRSGHLRMFDEMTTNVNDKDFLLFVDVEMYDAAVKNPVTGKRPRLMLEVGVLACQVADLWGPSFDEGAAVRHFIVEEHINRRNKHCEDRKFDFDMAFGWSEILELAEVQRACGKIIQHIHESAGDVGRKYLVGHSINGDKRWLEEDLGLDLSGFTEVDLADAYASHHGFDGRTRLTTMCEVYGIDALAPHNGGNDVMYTAELCRRMMRQLLVEINGPLV